jgi:hypothetical protein
MMGYCHYWGRPAELSRDRFRAFAAECKQLRTALGVPTLGLFGGVKIGGATGWGKPIFSEETICFNGRPMQETLLIHRVFHHPERETGDYGLHWDFVKTNQAPYDELVVAVLLSFKQFFPETALYSDGGAAEWANGIALYERTTGRTVPAFPILAQPQGESAEHDQN